MLDDMLDKTYLGYPVPSPKGNTGKALTSDGVKLIYSSFPDGSGDVVAPASNTDNRIPQWNGADSKTLKDGLAFKDEDDMFSDSDTAVPSQQSVKAYVTSMVTGNVYPTALNYAALPAAADHTNEIYVCLQSQGVWLINLKRSGMYISDGSTWTKLSELPSTLMSQATYDNDADGIVDEAAKISGTPGNDKVYSTDGSGVQSWIDKTDLNSDTVAFDDEFYLDGQNQITDVSLLRVKIPYDCYIISHAVKLETQRTAGTIDLKIMKNETLLVATGLNLQINASYPLDQLKTVTYGTSGYDFTAGDILEIIGTSVSFAPLSNLASINLVIQIN